MNVVPIVNVSGLAFLFLLLLSLLILQLPLPLSLLSLLLLSHYNGPVSGFVSVMVVCKKA